VVSKKKNNNNDCGETQGSKTPTIRPTASHILEPSNHAKSGANAFVECAGQKVIAVRPLCLFKGH
jgi:hypothetical protein